MTLNFDDCLPELRSRGLLPDGIRAAYISGSIARGWGHAASDLDIYLICPQPWVSETAQQTPVAVTPDVVPLEVTHVDKMRWTVEYWLDEQIEQILAKVSHERFEAGSRSVDLMTSPMQKELNILERLSYAVPLAGADWLAARAADVKASALTSFAASSQLNLADTYVEDAVGQVKSGDLDSAVISAKSAFGHAIDALMAFHGEVGRDGKWRARRFRTVQPSLLGFDEYWRFETMQDFDPDNPAAWVESVVDLCRRVSFEVVI